MHKRDYETLAKAFKQCLETSKSAKATPEFVNSPEWTLRMLAHELCAELVKDNPQFKRQKFLEACGFGEPEVSDAETLALNCQ